MNIEEVGRRRKLLLEFKYFKKDIFTPVFNNYWITLINA